MAQTQNKDKMLELTTEQIEKKLSLIHISAVACGRKVVVTGRSMIQNTDIARRLGYLKIQDVDLIDAYDLKGIPPEKVVIMCTGCLLYTSRCV